MTKFVCNDCGYRFESEKEYQKKCPYCSSKNVEKEKNASELLRDLDGKLDYVK